MHLIYITVFFLEYFSVDTYESNEGSLYCKPHFKALFTPKAVEDDTPRKLNKKLLVTCYVNWRYSVQNNFSET